MAHVKWECKYHVVFSFENELAKSCMSCVGIKALSYWKGMQCPIMFTYV
jgi:hypothetical protein